MAFVARASRILPVSAEVAFDHLADHDSWPKWMPASFEVVGRTVGRLAVGAKLRVRIKKGPLPVSIRVVVVRSPAEITWTGGVRGVLRAEHRFLFRAKGESSVEVESVETWSGVVATLLRWKIQPDAEEVGRDQLAGLARVVAASD